MDLITFLNRNSSSIKKSWFIKAMNTYPQKAEKYLTGNADQFSNPVGATMHRELNTLFDIIIGKSDSSQSESCIENIVKIRAVQDFSPSQAVSFIFDLKGIIWEEISKLTTIDPHQWHSLEATIDSMVFKAFDSYMAMRERLYEIKANETKRTFGKMVERLSHKAGLN